MDWKGEIGKGVPIELPQEKGYRGRSQAKELNQSLTHNHGYRENDHEFIIEEGVFAAGARPV